MIKRINWVFLIAGTLIMLMIMNYSGRTLKTPSTPLGILNLELAYHLAESNRVLSSWSTANSYNVDNIRVAIQNTWLDFIFIFFYSLFLFYACKSISDTLSGFIKRAGQLFALGALYAGLLDIGENAGMLFELNGFNAGGISLFTAICSVAKWSLVFLALTYILSAGLFSLIKGKTPP